MPSARMRCSRRRVQSPSGSDRVLCWPTSSASLSSAQRRKPLDSADVLRFLALLAGRDVELDALSLVESSVSVTLDGREVHEDIVPPLDGDEPVALLCVEPLDRAGRCHALLRSLPFPTESASVSGCICKGQWRVANRFGPDGTRAVVRVVSIVPHSAATEADSRTVSQRTNRQPSPRQITRFGGSPRVHVHLDAHLGFRRQLPIRPKRAY